MSCLLLRYEAMIMLENAENDIVECIMKNMYHYTEVKQQQQQGKIALMSFVVALLYDTVKHLKCNVM